MPSAEYMQKRRARIRAEMTALLGGQCARCEVTENLHFDHIDPTTKLFSISAGLNRSRVELLAEVAKCQLLCVPHHQEKTAGEPKRPARGERVGSAKLTADDIRAIRESPLSQRKIALLYGVSRNQIQNIRQRKSWAHI